MNVPLHAFVIRWMCLQPCQRSPRVVQVLEENLARIPNGHVVDMLGRFVCVLRVGGNPMLVVVIDSAVVTAGHQETTTEDSDQLCLKHRFERDGHDCFHPK